MSVYKIIDIFDIGNDRSVLMVKSELSEKIPLGTYKVISPNYPDISVSIDGYRPDTKDKTGKLHLVVTTVKLDLKHRMDQSISCNLVFIGDS
jgi:hypothetical protein